MEARSILCIQINQFYVQTLGAEMSPPTIVHRDKTVLDANSAALARGIAVGMDQAEAKAILGREATYHRWEEEPYRLAQCRWLDVCAEFTDSVEPVDQHEAFLDLSEHPDPIEIRLCLIKKLLIRTELTALTGLADCRWVARVALRSEPRLIGNHRAFVAPLPVHALPVEPVQTRRLFLLGCRTVGDVAAMPLDTLRKPFGKEAQVIHRLAQGSGEATVTPLYPPDSIGGRFSFDGGTSEQGVFDNGLKHMSLAIGRRLAEREICGEVLEVWIENEDGTVEELSRKFSKPIGSPGSLLFSLKVLCGIRPKAVAKIRFRIPGLKKAARVQRTLENMTTSGAKPAARVSAIANVKAAFGDGSIQLASEMQEPRWKQVRRAWGAASGWNWR